MALGMGRVSTLSSLGAPLEFSVALSAQATDSLAPECISADVYAGDRRVPPEMVSVRIGRAGDGTPSSLRVTTGIRIDEPVASVEVVLDCGVRVSRKYVVFIDPPTLNLAQADDAVPAASRAQAPRREPSARATTASGAARRARSARTAGGPRPGGTGVASATRQRSSEAASAARAARAAVPARAEAGSRLKLESAPAQQGAAPVRDKPALAGGAAAGSAAVVAAGSGTPSAATPASGSASGAVAVSAAASAGAGGGLLGELASRAEADTLALNAERLRSLEESLLRLRSDNQVMQKSVGELQARLREAEASRYSNPVVLGLLALLALLVLALLALLWRQASLRKESDWLRAAAASNETAGRPAAAVRSVVHPAGAGAASAAAGAALTGGEGAQAAQRSPAGAAAAAGDPRAAALADLPATQGAANAQPPAAVVVRATSDVPNHEVTAVHDPRREVSVEELIDLEQQADFFVVLGQDDAAIDLLMGHVQGTGGASPLPYLKLLEIHRRRDERDAYDRVRERFNRRFNAFAPEWEAHSGHNRSLEDYPAVVEHLQDLWRDPTAAMDELASLLFQRDLTAQTFDLPAYGELLFLYSLARELAEDQPPADGVDLLLPLDEPLLAGQAAAPALMGAAVAGAAAVLVSKAAPAASLDELSLSPVPGLDELPSLPSLPAVPATYPVPLGFANPEAPTGDLPSFDEGLLDLNISDEPEEPKGPLSRH